jgi:hypothetical protein
MHLTGNLTLSTFLFPFHGVEQTEKDMLDKSKALCLVLILMAATLAGQMWGDKALIFLVHVVVVLLLEMVVSFLAGVDNNPDT